MKQWALVDPEDQVRSMANDPEALDEMVEQMDAQGVSGWRVVSCDLRFWQSHPELAEGDGSS